MLGRVDGMPLGAVDENMLGSRDGFTDGAVDGSIDDSGVPHTKMF